MSVKFVNHVLQKNTISNLMKNYIGGLQEFTPKLMPIHAPNINSYRRLFATWDAPRNTNWGIGNRSCGFRIPSNEEYSMRIENRISGSDTNPYLVISANLAAGYLGIKNKIKPTEETKKSVFGQKQSSLPTTMEEAISLFEMMQIFIFCVEIYETFGKNKSPNEFAQKVGIEKLIEIRSSED